MKKSQAANEAALVVGFMTIFLIVFISVLSDQLIGAGDQRIKENIEDLADVIHSELSMAANAQEGYSRTFTLPQYIEGSLYTVLFHNKSNTQADFTELIVTTTIAGSEYSAVRILPENVTGNLAVGRNIVTKSAGVANITSTRPSLLILLKDLTNNAIFFRSNGDVVLKGKFTQEKKKPKPKKNEDELIIKSNGENVAILNMMTGNMVIKGILKENQASLSNPPTEDFVVKNSDKKVVAYIDEAGNFHIAGRLTQNGAP